MGPQKSLRGIQTSNVLENVPQEMVQGNIFLQLNQNPISIPGNRISDTFNSTPELEPKKI